MPRFALLLAAAATALAACSSEPPTTAELLVGEWEQVGEITITQGGPSILITEGEVEYDADGTAEGELIMRFVGAPENADEYRFEATSTYALDGNTLTDTMQSVTVTALDDSEQANQLAALITNSTPPGQTSTSTIVSVDRKTLVMRDETTGTESTYKRE